MLLSVLLQATAAAVGVSKLGAAIGADVYKRQEYGTQMQFKFIQVLCARQCHHTCVMRTRREFGEIDSIIMA